jgi:hypothetical protein
MQCRYDDDEKMNDDKNMDVMALAIFCPVVNWGQYF